MSMTVKQAIMLGVIAEVRLGCGPDPYEPNGKPTACRVCGDIFWQWKQQRKRYCPWCSGHRQIKAQDALRDREGEFYEKAVIRQLKHWTAEAKRLGLTLPAHQS